MKKYTLLLIYMLFTMNLSAELPPYVYENLKKNSPEVLKIKVIKVTSSPKIINNSKDITIQAKVLNVKTSQSGLKAGDMITIIYNKVTNRPKGWVGPSSLPILERSEVYKAFVEKASEASYYVPSARGKSFE